MGISNIEWTDLTLIPGSAVNMSPQAAIIVMPKRKTNSDGGTVVLGAHMPSGKERLRRIGKIPCVGINQLALPA
jgi:hypothetical protein